MRSNKNLRQLTNSGTIERPYSASNPPPGKFPLNYRAIQLKGAMSVNESGSYPKYQIGDIVICENGIGKISNIEIDYEADKHVVEVDFDIQRTNMSSDVITAMILTSK